MPKHVPGEHYLGSPHKLSHKVTIHPEIEHRPNDTKHYLLPAVFTIEKGSDMTIKYPGPGVLHIIEGEAQYIDTAKPETPTVLTTGAVVHLEEGTVLHWSSPSSAKGFAVFHVPASIKGFDAFVVSE